MKKHLLFKIVLTLIPVMGILVLNSFSGGVTGGLTGSPRDGDSCLGCHAPGADFGATASITTNIPVEGYALGETYEITLSANSTAGAYGFQITAENPVDEKTGTWASTDTETQTVDGNTRATHASPNAAGSWTLEWTAPNTDEGTVTFYAAVNAVNGNGNNAGDQVVFTQTSNVVLSAEDPVFADLAVYPNPVVEQLKVYLPQTVSQAKVVAYNALGKEVLKANIDKLDNMLDVSRFQNGVYMLAIYAEGKRTTKTFIKR